MSASPVSEQGPKRSGKPMIVLDQVSKSFDGGHSDVVHEVSLSIDTGSLVAVVGASGSGKTTLVKMINRLVEPDSGTVSIDGRPVSDTPPPLLRRGIGYVFQAIGLFPHMTIAENIAITPQLLGWPANEIAARVDELLDLANLPRGFSSRFPAELSGGERQRIAVARALAARPRIVLMDEPFGALDPLTRDALRTAYRTLHDSLGLTTIMVTHDVQEAVLMSDRILVLEQGEIVADGTPAQLMSENAQPRVAALMATPRRQAARIRMIIDGDPAEQRHV